MKKKNTIIFISVFLLLIVLVYALKMTQISEQKKLEAQKDAIVSDGITLTLDDSTGISKAVLILLEKSGNDLTAGYPLDESFYYWLARAYGKDVICDVAYAVNNGTAASDVWEKATGYTMHTLYSEYCMAKGLMSYDTKNVAWASTEKLSPNTITVLGDVCFSDGWLTTNKLEENGGDISSVISEDLLRLMNSSAVTWINNEFVFEDNGTPLEGKDYCFGTATENVDYLKEMGVTISSLANNHVYDFGAEGLLSTMDTLSLSGINYVGAGKNIDEAMTPKYYVVNGKKIALVAATQVEITLNFTKEATETTPGVLKTLDSYRFCQVIRQAKANADYVIVYAHWGWEGSLYPSAEQRVLAKDYVAAGADVIIGNHAHRMQGVNYVDGVPVIWSLGNFWLSNASLYTMMVQIEVNELGDLDISIVPCLQSNLTTSLIADPDEVAAFYEYVVDLSYGVGITSTGYIGQMSEGMNGFYTYLSGKKYADRDPNKDLYGNAIDGVGNLE